MMQTLIMAMAAPVTVPQLNMAGNVQMVIQQLLVYESRVEHR